MAQRAATSKPRPRRVVTNGNGDGRTLVAAATRLRIDQREEVKKALALREDWQSLSWDFYDAIGELKYGVNLQGNAMSKLRLYSAIEPESQDEDPPADTDERAIAALERLRGVTGGHAELMRELGIHLSVPGACWMVGLAERAAQTRPDGTRVEASPERWFIASTEEVSESDGRPVVEDPDTGTKIPLRAESDVGSDAGAEADFWARIWRRHPRHGARADSAVRGVLSACEELLIVDRSMRSLARSRVSFGKILFVPDDISFGSTDSSTDAAGADGAEDPFETEMMEAFTTPIQDEGSAAAVAPIVLRGKRSDAGSGIEVIELPRTGDELLHQRGEHALRRIAQGINLPVELIFGLGEANHWGGGEIQRSAFDQHFQPLAILCVDALTTAYYRSALLTAGMSPEEAARRFIWFDPVDLIVDARKAEVLDAHDRLIVSDGSARRVLGYGDDDAPDEAEYERRAALKRPTREPVAPTDAPSEGVMTAAVVADLGRRLVDIDRHLRSRLAAALDATLRDALRQVGNRLANRAQGKLAESLRQVPPEAVAATIGRGRVASLEDPASTIELAVDRVEQRFIRWTEQAQRAALGLLGLDSGPRAVLEARQDRDRADAWAWLRQALVDLVNLRIYEPHPEAPAEGEFDENLTVPADVVREAMALAGGAGRGTRTASLFVRLGGIARAFGIGTGPVLTDGMAEVGVGVAGFRWEYGPAMRTHPFEPHRALDGVEFVNFDDPVLANTRGFPASPFFVPGDHPGCVCDVVPIIIEAGR